MSWTVNLPLINGYKVVGVIPVKHDQGLRPPYVIIFHRPKDYTRQGNPIGVQLSGMKATHLGVGALMTSHLWTKLTRMPWSVLSEKVEVT